jgi:hypothetical protein
MSKNITASRSAMSAQKARRLRFTAEFSFGAGVWFAVLAMRDAQPMYVVPAVAYAVVIAVSLYRLHRGR